MPERSSILVLVLLVMLVSGCASAETPQSTDDKDGGAITDEDATTADGGADAGPRPDAGPQFKAPQFYHSTSGGGLSTSGGFRMQLNVGAPMPRGTSSNDEFRMRFGPVSP